MHSFVYCHVSRVNKNVIYFNLNSRAQTLLFARKLSEIIIIYGITLVYKDLVEKLLNSYLSSQKCILGTRFSFLSITDDVNFELRNRKTILNILTESFSFLVLTRDTRDDYCPKKKIRISVFVQKH